MTAAHIKVAMAACFLRNTSPKSVQTGCVLGSSSLRRGTRPLMSAVRRRGEPQVDRLVFSGQVRAPGDLGSIRGPSRGACTRRSRNPPTANNWRFKMKMVKSLLLGSAAGLVAVTAGQAADLPVKAKPVEYVKICSLYGAGFYYMPGTDLCIKIGGWVRAEATYGNNNGSMTWGPFSGQENNRVTSNFVDRER